MFENKIEELKKEINQLQSSINVPHYKQRLRKLHFALGTFLENDGQYLEAICHYIFAAREDNCEAARRLGLIKSEEQISILRLRALSGGNFLLRAYQYLGGIGVDQNDHEAFHIFNDLADQGNAAAQCLQ